MPLVRGKEKPMKISYRLFCLIFSALALAVFLTVGCGNKKDATTAEAKKTFVGAQSINEVPEQYRKMEKR